MHYGIIAGSHRQNSQSSKIGAYLATALKRLDGSATTDIIDLKGNPLPLWDESAWQQNSALAKQWLPYAERLRRCDAFCVISPEWAGMVPAGLKNFLIYCGAQEVGHKPALIVAVSAGRGGSYPVNELRTSGYKNNKLLYLPEHIIVQNAPKVLNDGDAADKDDDYIRRRIDYALRQLQAYAAALQTVRASGVTGHPDFPFGM